MFNFPSTAEVIWRQGHGLESHLTDWRKSWGSLGNPWVQGEWFIHNTTEAPAGHFAVPDRKLFIVYNQGLPDEAFEDRQTLN